VGEEYISMLAFWSNTVASLLASHFLDHVIYGYTILSPPLTRFCDSLSYNLTPRVATQPVFLRNCSLFSSAFICVNGFIQRLSLPSGTVSYHGYRNTLKLYNDQ
uniref:Uncharacterized protein n=1 Tax=Sparus aurata TaxID=8175 RepID=A0A671U1C2_SPAAU